MSEARLCDNPDCPVMPGRIITEGRIILDIVRDQSLLPSAPDKGPMDFCSFDCLEVGIAAERKRRTEYLLSIAP